MIFSLVSPDGDAGYPGNLQLSVTYSLAGDTLSITYEAESDQDTLLNLTNHAYYNLSGADEKIYDHELLVEADTVAESNRELIPSGVFLPVEGTPFDFREFHRIGERINDDNELLRNGEGYDHALMLREGGKVYLRHPASGRELVVETDLPAVQIYSGTHLGGTEVGHGGKPYTPGDGVALETEFLPDSIHAEKEPKVILRAGKKFRSVTSMTFRTY